MVKEIKVGKIMTKIWPVRTVVIRDKAADCWSKKKDGSKGSKGGKGKKGSSKGSNEGSTDGKKGKGKGKPKKHASALDEAGEEEDAEYEAGDEPENEEVDTFDINGVTMNSEPHDCGEWTKFNLDTGTIVTFKTASGELVPSEGTGPYVGSDEN